MNPLSTTLALGFAATLVLTSPAASAQQSIFSDAETFGGGPDPGDVVDEVSRELQLLDEARDRKVVKYEEELQRQIDKAQAEFDREAAKEDNPQRIEDKRHKLEEKIDRAYDRFQRKIQDENERYDEKRENILAKRRGS